MRKKRLCFFVISVFMIFMFCLPTFALSVETEDVKIDIPENFTVINTENVSENKEYLESINFSEKSFKDYITDKSVIVYATDKQNAEITLTKKSAGFSAEIDDLFFIDENGIREIFNSILGSNEYNIVDCGKNRFIQMEYQNRDKGGTFSGFELITVKNGKIYTINYTVSGENKIDENTKLALTTSFEYTGSSKLKKVGADTVITIIILIVAILFFIGVAIYIVLSFYKDIKARKDQSDVAPYVKIKRRKF